jgi:tetratricopeptide (TPR) repeat protein
MRMGEEGVLAPDVAFPEARRAALESLQIEDRAEPLVILAALKLNYEWGWAGAERALRHAMALDPDLVEARLSYARLLSAAGRHADAIEEARAAEVKRPGCPDVVRDATLVFYRAHRFDEAERGFRAWSELEPARRDPHHWLALLFQVAGRPPEAKREARLVLKMAGTPSAYLARFDALAPARAMELYLRGSIRYLERLAGSKWVSADDFARLRAQLGERENALRDLNRAADERSPRLLPYLADPAFDSMRDDPRFQALVRRVHVPARSGDRVG